MFIDFEGINLRARTKRLSELTEPHRGVFVGGDGDAGEHGRVHDRGCGFFRHVMSVCEDPRLKQSSGHENLSQLTQPIQYGKQHHLSPNLNGYMS